MKRQTLQETKLKVLADPKHQMVYIMDFVDDFRKAKDPALAEDFIPDGTPLDALLASIVEALCLEMNLEPPDVVFNVPPLKSPYFVSGIESLKAITIVESPVTFKRRNIFVLKNFLERV